MNAVERFLNRYVLSAVGILVLFLSVNLGLLAVFLIYLSASGATGGTFPTEEFSDHILKSEDGFEADERALALLHDADAWAMILSDNGTVIWEKDLPDELLQTYTVTDAALFGRWYLEDYPVRIWKRAEGLLVVGFPPGSVLQLYLSFKLRYFGLLLTGAAGIILANVLLLMFLFLRNTRRLEKAIGPILTGICALSSGKIFHLEEKGELAEINAGLNRAGRYLLQKDNTRAEWIRGVSHDIRTPLSMILGYASEMETISSLPADIRKQAGIIRRQSQKIKELIDSLNLTTKLEYAMYPIHLQAINPVELTRRTVIDFLNDGLFDGYELTFFADQSIGQAQISADAALLHRMLCNLINNSITHNPQGCRITVSVANSCGSWIFSVLDDGQGICEEKLRSFQDGSANESAPPAQDTGYEHGLGLKIVCQIVKVHGGKIRFSNAAPHGLHVKIQLPG